MNHHETSVAIITTNNDKIESIIESQKKSLQDALNDIRALLGITLFVVCIEWLYTDFFRLSIFSADQHSTHTKFYSALPLRAQ